MAAGQRLTFKVFRKAGVADYRVVAQDGPRPLAPGSLNTFAVDLAVEPGDIIGINTANPGGPDVACGVATPFAADEFAFRTPGLGPGAAGPYLPGNSSIINVAAIVEQSNEFRFARKRIDRKRGTASLTVAVPGPGKLTLFGKGLRTGTASSTAAGEVSVPVRPAGKLKRALRGRGKALARAKVEFAPADGTPRTQATPVKLKLRRGR